MEYFGKKLKKIFAYSVYRKTLYAYAVSFFVLVVVILASSFALMLSNIKNQNMDASQQLLTQLVSSAEKIKTNVDDVITLVAGDSNTMRFAKNTTENKLDNYRLYSKLANTKMAYSYIENIFVMNLTAESCVSVVRNEQDTVQEAKALVEQALEDKRFIVSRTVNYFNQRTENVVSFIQLLPYDSCAIVIDVNADWFQYDLANSSKVNRMAYVIDSAGNTITNNVRMKVGERELSEYLYRLVSKTEASEFVYSDAKESKILFFEKAEALDWWFVDIQDYSYFYSSFQKMAFVFLGVAVCFILFCVGISIFFSRKIRKPLIQLADKYRGAAGVEDGSYGDELKYIDRAIARVEHERYRNESYLKNQMVRVMILGEVLPFSVSEETAKALWQSYESPYYAVLLLKIQPLDEIEAEKLAAEMKIFRYTVCNISEEVFSQVFSCKAVDVGENTVGVLIQLENEQVPDDYVLCFRQLKEFLEKQIRITVSGALGMTVDTQEEICTSYRKAKQYLEVGGFTNKDDLIDSTSATGVSYQEKNDKLVDSIVEYIKLNFMNSDLSLKSISQKFGLSTAYLGKIFKSVQGEAFSAFLTAYRLERSKELLLETTKTVNEIAQEIGFTNPTYYSTVFKNTFGMTPSAFRTRKT